MRGEIMRRYMQESPKAGMGRGIDTTSGQWNTSIESGRRSTINKTHEVTGEAGGAYEVGLQFIEQRPLT